VGRAYFVVSGLARLPLSMLVIGALTYTVGVSGDVALGGAVAAVTGIGVALGAPLSGAASDRWGQRVTLLTSAVLYAAALVWLLLAGRGANDGLTPAFALAALLAGVVVPQAGPMTRVRWLRRWGGHGGRIGALETAQGYESTVDELGFVLGPAVVGVVAALIGPAAPLVAALALTAISVPWFALHPTAAYASPHAAHGEPASSDTGSRPGPAGPGAGPSVPDAARSSRAGSVAWGLVGLLLLGMLSIGTSFGSLATVSTAFADETGHPGTGGLIYSTLGLTSGLAALSVSRWPARWGVQRRWIACAALLVPVTALLWLPNEPWQLALALLLLGAPIGPVLVTVFTAAGARTPSHRLGLVMTLLSAGITLGTSVGNWLGGELARSGGHTAALWVSLGAAVALLLVGLVFAAAERARMASPEHTA